MRNVDDALNQVRRWLQSPAAARAWHDGWIAAAPPHEAAVATPVPSAGDPAVPPIQVDRGSELSRVGQPLVPGRFRHRLRSPCVGLACERVVWFCAVVGVLHAALRRRGGPLCTTSLCVISACRMRRARLPTKPALRCVRPLGSHCWTRSSSLSKR
jgi:hypothetical protein